MEIAISERYRTKDKVTKIYLEWPGLLEKMSRGLCFLERDDFGGGGVYIYIYKVSTRCSCYGHFSRVRTLVRPRQIQAKKGSRKEIIV